MKNNSSIYITIIFCIAQFLSENIYAKNLSTSIIIPCTHKHAHYLYQLLKLYERQTVLPNEIVISLSESNNVEDYILKTIQFTSWKIPVILLLSPDKKYAGTNRNIASHKASGDILIYQDADDAPHPQRVEIIKYFFENYEVEHLMHYHDLYGEVTNFNYLIPTDIKFSYETDLRHVFKTKAHQGCPAISKATFQKIKWPDTAHKEDLVFHQKSYKKLSKRMIIHTPLYIYMRELSSWGKNFTEEYSNIWHTLYDTFYRTYTIKPLKEKV